MRSQFSRDGCGFFAFAFRFRRDPSRPATEQSVAVREAKDLGIGIRVNACELQKQVGFGLVWPRIFAERDKSGFVMFPDICSKQPNWAASPFVSVFRDLPDELEKLVHFSTSYSHTVIDSASVWTVCRLN